MVDPRKAWSRARRARDHKEGKKDITSGLGDGDRAATEKPSRSRVKVNRHHIPRIHALDGDLRLRGRFNKIGHPIYRL